jgi:hypothetical protein
MIGFLKRNGVFGLFSDEEQQKTPQRGGVHGPFSPKATAVRRPFDGAGQPTIVMPRFKRGIQ